MLQAKVTYCMSQHVNHDIKHKAVKDVQKYHFGTGRLVLFEFVLAIAMFIGLGISTYSIVGCVYFIKWLVTLCV